MALPLKPPIKPQLALSRKQLPEGEEWVYEPKYDGFRALAYVDGDDVYLQSRGGKPLRRYFPEVEFPAGRYVMDGELVILDEDGREEFNALQNRLHPAESRVRKAAEPLLLSGEGVIAKQLDAVYKPGERKGMVKVKRVRTIDCVVMGWRPGKHEGTVGSLILGLYDDGSLRPIGHTSGLKAKEKKELVETLKPYETGEKGSGDPSRWDADRELEWYSLRPELVVEVTYDHTSGGRIRHVVSYKHQSLVCGTTSSNPPTPIYCVDTIGAGPVLLGPGGGLMYDINDRLAGVLQVNSVLAFPEFTAHLDGNIGVAYAF